MLYRLLLTWMCLAGLAQAEVKVYSLLPDDSQLQAASREMSLGFMQSYSLPGAGEVRVVDSQGKEIFKGTLQDQRWYVLHSKGVTEAGSLSGTPGKQFAFFNANNYAIQMALYVGKDEDEEPLAEIPVPAHSLCSPQLAPVGEKFKVYLRDEGGNPLGTSYTPVRPGHIYLIYRKRPTLYDIEDLGLIR